MQKSSPVVIYLPSLSETQGVQRCGKFPKQGRQGYLCQVQNSQVVRGQGCGGGGRNLAPRPCVPDGKDPVGSVVAEAGQGEGCPGPAFVARAWAGASQLGEVNPHPVSRQEASFLGPWDPGVGVGGARREGTVGVDSGKLLTTLWLPQAAGERDRRSQTMRAFITRSWSILEWEAGPWPRKEGMRDPQALMGQTPSPAALLGRYTHAHTHARLLQPSWCRELCTGSRHSLPS